MILSWYKVYYDSFKMLASPSLAQPLQLLVDIGPSCINKSPPVLQLFMYLFNIYIDLYIPSFSRFIIHCCSSLFWWANCPSWCPFKLTPVFLSHVCPCPHLQCDYGIPWKYNWIHLSRLAFSVRVCFFPFLLISFSFVEYVEYYHV